MFLFAFPVVQLGGIAGTKTLKKQDANKGVAFLILVEIPGRFLTMSVDVVGPDVVIALIKVVWGKF